MINAMLGFGRLPVALAFVSAALAGDGDWPHWRGPNDDGMARGDAPLHWSDEEHIAWKAAIPGRGHSSPVVWADRLFLTTAVPIGNASGGGLVAHKFGLLVYDLETGKRIWSARGLGQNTIPAPVAWDGMVFVMSGFRNPNLMAIQLGREGDLTGTDAVVWQNQRGNSYTPSPRIA